MSCYNEIASKVEKFQDKIKDAMVKIRNVSVRFELSNMAKEFDEKVSSIGEIILDETKLKYESGKLCLFRTDFRNGEIKVIRTLNVTMSGVVNGIFVDGHMIFTAYKSKKVIKYNKDGEVLGELTDPANPTDICHVSEARLLVSSKASAFYVVDSTNMTLQKTIKLAVNMWGVCFYDNSQLLVGSNKSQLTWIEQSSGTTLRSVKTSGYSCNVSTSGNNDYIYGDGYNSVSYVVNDTKKFTYTNSQLSYPSGNAMDYDDNFYIAGNHSCNIHQITDTGELIRIIPALTVGEQPPWNIRFEKGTNRFLVTCYNTGNASLCCID